MVFELVSYPSDPDMYLRPLFRNGTSPESPLTEFLLFGQGGQGALMPYGELSGFMDKIAIDNLDQWCQVCDSEEDTCQARHMCIDVQPVGQPGHEARACRWCWCALCACCSGNCRSYNDDDYN
ncbi:hypothetical protein HOY82DRAFT_541876 [Tuber indicum]|nr:hypothetical protein HOY82DRAFT_541876 [Tuber indicum]